MTQLLPLKYMRLRSGIVVVGSGGGVGVGGGVIVGNGGSAERNIMFTLNTQDTDFKYKVSQLNFTILLKYKVLYFCILFVSFFLA